MEKHLKSILVAAVSTLGIFLIRFQFDWLLNKAGMPMLFLLIPTVISALYGGVILGLLATFVSLTLGWYFFIDPTHSFTIGNQFSAYQLGVFSIQGFIISILCGAVYKAHHRLNHLVSKSRQAEESLRRSERLTRAIAENSPECIVTMDLSGKILFFSPERQIVSLLGAPQASNWLDLWDPATRPLAEKALVEGKAGHIGRFAGVSISRQEGPLYWESVVINLDEHHILAISRDVTEQRTAQLVLAHNEKRYRSLITATSAIAWTSDVKGAFIEPQASWEDYTGQSWKEHKAWGWLKAVHPDDRESIRLLWQEASASHKSFEIESKLWNQNSKDYHTFLVRGVPIFDKQGKIEEWVGTVNDIEEQKKVAEELHSAKNIAEQASKAKTHFLANMSHEIRTPLNAILGFTDILLNKNIDQEYNKYTSIIMRNAQQLHRLVNEILDVSEIESEVLNIAMKEFSLPNLIQGVYSQMLSLSKKKGLHFSFTTEGNIPSIITSDPVRLRQILVNLIENAIKFTDHGRVDVQMRLKDQLHSQHESLLEFTISDTGIGLSEDQQQQIFRPFVQGDGSMTRRYGGIGVGLYLAKRLANLLHGDLALVNSALGQGSIFKLTVHIDNSKTLDFPSPKAIHTDLETTGINSNMSTSQPLEGVKVLLTRDNLDYRSPAAETMQLAHVNNSFESRDQYQPPQDHDACSSKKDPRRYLHKFYHKYLAKPFSCKSQNHHATFS